MLLLVLTNEKGHDYQVLEGAYLKGQESFGYLFYTLGGVFRELNLEYFWFHFFYQAVFCSVLCLLARNIAAPLIFLFIFGDVFNEQMRFFSAFVFSFYAFQKFKPLALMSYLIHPAAFLLSTVSFIGGRFLSKPSWPASFALLGLATLVSFFAFPMIVFVASFFGYGYVGSIHFERISIPGLLALMGIFLWCCHESRSDRSPFMPIILAASLAGVAFSQVAIVSGRLLIISSLLILLLSSQPRLWELRFAKVRVSRALNFVFASILLIVWAVR